ncbi:MAG: DUF4384 domain-containing protein [Myxococcales bacterium]|nr:DUF4384 domain-containing protein [Myxococcales bacterium]
MSHLSDFALEEHLLDRAKHAGHVAACERCRSRLARMEEEGRHFRQFVYPATLEALEKPRGRSWVRLLSILTPVGFVAAAGLVLIARKGPDSGYVGTKGGALKLTVYTASRALNDGESVAASASLRFRVQVSSPCELLVLSLDDSGQISRIYGPSPAKGDAALPGGAKLDGRAGTERFFAICTPKRVAGIEDLVRAAGQGPVRDLPSGSTQASLLLKKSR